MTINALARAVHNLDNVEEIRLKNWGAWSIQSAYPAFEPPSWAQLWKLYIRSNHISKVVAEQDALNLELAISTMDLLCRMNTDPSASGALKWGTLYSYILKQHYATRHERTCIHLAENVRRKFKRPCAESTYFQHLARAKRYALTLAPGI